MIQIDMEMPKNCKFCPLHDVNPDQCPIRTIYKDDYATSRFTDCPLYKIAEDTDTISRQAVIEAINKIFPADPMRDDYTQGITCGAALANIYVAQLPSAQPETHEKRTETHACDLINRQAAIEAMEDVDWYHIGKDGQLVHGANSKEDEPLYKAEDVYKVLEQLPSAQPEPCEDTISRQAVISVIAKWMLEYGGEGEEHERNALKQAAEEIKDLPSAQPERLTDDDFETIRIHLNAYKEKLCNQHRWEEANEYQRIIDRFMAFASAQPEIIRCKDCKYNSNTCGNYVNCGIIPQMFGRTVDNYCSRAERRTDEGD